MADSSISVAAFFISRIKMYGTSCERKDMKTNQIMIRPMGEFTVSQRTKDGYFDGGDLLRQWNSVKGNEQRKMDEFLLAKRTGDFIEALIAEERENGLGENSPKIDNQVVKKSKVKEKGKAGRPKEEVWMHPFLFTKFAMWINPRFEVKVIRFVYDEMIQYRNLAGDAYPAMCRAVCSILPGDIFQKKIKDLAKSLNIIVYGKHESEMRNKIGDEDKIRELYELELQIAQWIDLGFIKDYNSLKSTLTKKKYGKPKKHYESFSNERVPIDKMRAVNSDICDYASYYFFQNGVIVVSISPFGCVKVSYEDEYNSLLGKQEEEKYRENDI